MFITQRLHDAIEKVCPILGVGVPVIGNSSLVKISFKPEADDQQRLQAQQVVDGFDWSDQAEKDYQKAVNLKNAITNFTNDLALQAICSIQGIDPQVVIDKMKNK